MCGIVGYVGKKEATPFLVGGLRRLEYRGYDSAGIATLPSSGGAFQLNRAVGKIDRLAELLALSPMTGFTGIGHTRWATHGPATTENAHPHLGGRGLVAVVHNGVIVPDDATALSEGTRVRITPAVAEEPRPFGERYAEFKGAVPGLPTDLATQHEHYRLGTPKR